MSEHCVSLSSFTAAQAGKTMNISDAVKMLRPTIVLVSIVYLQEDIVLEVRVRLVDLMFEFILRKKKAIPEGLHALLGISVRVNRGCVGAHQAKVLLKALDITVIKEMTRDDTCEIVGAKLSLLVHRLQLGRAP
jgi:hypothetical protein